MYNGGKQKSIYDHHRSDVVYENMYLGEMINRYICDACQVKFQSYDTMA